jgi:FMN phosphatase YigB (HAD superfamily)
MDSFDRFFLPEAKHLQDAFHEINNSFNVKKLKSDEGGKWFEEILQRHSMKAKDSILIDDSLENCETIQKLGGKYYNSKTEEEVLDVLNEILTT